jgi:ribosomal protein S18 acetylase RimI-like enzyme
MIRLACPDDCTAIEALVREAYSPYVARIGREPGPMLDDYAALIAQSRVHVLEEEAGIAGAVVLVPEADTMLLDNVAVSPRAQGRGYGRKLIAFAEEAAREAGYATIRLYTNEAMTENLALYPRLGFVETHRGEEKGFRRIYMAKALTGAAI